MAFGVLEAWHHSLDLCENTNSCVHRCFYTKCKCHQSEKGSHLRVLTWNPSDLGYTLKGTWRKPRDSQRDNALGITEIQKHIEG